MGSETGETRCVFAQVFLTFGGLSYELCTSACFFFHIRSRAASASPCKWRQGRADNHLGQGTAPI